MLNSVQKMFQYFIGKKIAERLIASFLVLAILLVAATPQSGVIFLSTRTADASEKFLLNDFTAFSRLSGNAVIAADAITFTDRSYVVSPPLPTRVSGETYETKLSLTMTPSDDTHLYLYNDTESYNAETGHGVIIMPERSDTNIGVVLMDNGQGVTDNRDSVSLPYGQYLITMTDTDDQHTTVIRLPNGAERTYQQPQITRVHDGQLFINAGGTTIDTIEVARLSDTTTEAETVDEETGNEENGDETSESEEAGNEESTDPDSVENTGTTTDQDSSIAYRAPLQYLNSLLNETSLDETDRDLALAARAFVVGEERLNALALELSNASLSLRQVYVNDVRDQILAFADQIKAYEGVANDNSHNATLLDVSKRALLAVISHWQDIAEMYQLELSLDLPNLQTELFSSATASFEEDGTGVVAKLSANGLGGKLTLKNWRVSGGEILTVKKVESETPTNQPSSASSGEQLLNDFTAFSRLSGNAVIAADAITFTDRSYVVSPPLPTRVSGETYETKLSLTMTPSDDTHLYLYNDTESYNAETGHGVIIMPERSDTNIGVVLMDNGQGVTDNRDSVSLPYGQYLITMTDTDDQHTTVIRLPNGAERTYQQPQITRVHDGQLFINAGGTTIDTIEVARLSDTTTEAETVDEETGNEESDSSTAALEESAFRALGKVVTLDFSEIRSRVVGVQMQIAALDSATAYAFSGENLVEQQPVTNTQKIIFNHEDGLTSIVVRSDIHTRLDFSSISLTGDVHADQLRIEPLSPQTNRMLSVALAQDWGYPNKLLTYPVWERFLADNQIVQMRGGHPGYSSPYKLIFLANNINPQEQYFIIKPDSNDGSGSFSDVLYYVNDEGLGEVPRHFYTYYNGAIIVHPGAPNTLVVQISRGSAVNAYISNKADTFSEIIEREVFQPTLSIHRIANGAASQEGFGPAFTEIVDARTPVIFHNETFNALGLVRNNSGESGTLTIDVYAGPTEDPYARHMSTHTTSFGPYEGKSFTANVASPGGQGPPGVTFKMNINGKEIVAGKKARESQSNDIGVDKNNDGEKDWIDRDKLPENTRRYQRALALAKSAAETRREGGNSYYFDNIWNFAEGANETKVQIIEHGSIDIEIEGTVVALVESDVVLPEDEQLSDQDKESMLNKAIVSRTLVASTIDRLSITMPDNPYPVAAIGDLPAAPEVDLNRYREIKFQFALSEKSMVNIWTDLQGQYVSGTSMPIRPSIELRLVGTKELGRVYSAKSLGGAGQAISTSLSADTYTVTILDWTLYPAPGFGYTAADVKTPVFPVHIEAVPYRTQELAGMLSIDKRPQPTAIALKRRDRGEDLNIDKPVWVVIHGRNDNSESDKFKHLTQALIDKGYQVATVDWREGAKDNPLPLDGKKWTPAAGAWVMNQLNQAGFSAGKIILVGHSWGSYVSYYAADEYLRQTGNRVQAIVALDPAADGLWDDFPILPVHNTSEGVAFNAVSKTSWSFWSSYAGSQRRANTAAYNFNILPPGGTSYASFIPDWRQVVNQHGFPVSYFANLLNGDGDNSLRILDLQKMIAGQAIDIPVSSNNCEGSLSITTRSVNSYKQAVPKKFYSQCLDRDPDYASQLFPETGAGSTIQ